MTEPPRTSVITTAALVDAAFVVVFVLIGRRSHAEGLDPTGVAQTAWPFLVALTAGWLVAGAWRHPLAVWPNAVVIWATTVAVFLLGWRLGWRLVAALVRRRSQVRAAGA